MNVSLHDECLNLYIWSNLQRGRQQYDLHKLIFFLPCRYVCIWNFNLLTFEWIVDPLSMKYFRDEQVIFCAKYKYTYAYNYTIYTKYFSWLFILVKKLYLNIRYLVVEIFHFQTVFPLLQAPFMWSPKNKDNSLDSSEPDFDYICCHTISTYPNVLYTQTLDI